MRSAAAGAQLAKRTGLLQHITVISAYCGLLHACNTRVAGRSKARRNMLQRAAYCSVLRLNCCLLRYPGGGPVEGLQVRRGGAASRTLRFIAPYCSLLRLIAVPGWWAGRGAPSPRRRRRGQSRSSPPPAAAAPDLLRRNKTQSTAMCYWDAVSATAAISG